MEQNISTKFILKKIYNKPNLKIKYDSFSSDYNYFKIIILNIILNF